jgi:transmembrane sensor
MDPDCRDAFPSAIMAAARVWVTRREAGLDAPARHELQRWLAADPMHARAFARADEQRSDVDWALHVGAVDEVVEGLQQRARVRRSRRRVAVSVAAVALMCLGLFIREQAQPPPSLAPLSSSPIALSTIAPRSVALPDGSTAELREGAEIAIEYSTEVRRIRLLRGAAHFSVQSSPARPFVVRSGWVEVTAVGTEFAVHAGVADTDVFVTEGKVSVARFEHDQPHLSAPAARLGALSAPTLFLVAGESVSIPENASAVLEEKRRLPPLEMAEQLAWRLPVLHFSGAALQDIIAAMNPHNSVTVVLGDAALGQLELSGALRVDKVAVLQAMLESDFPIRAEREGDVISLYRKTDGDGLK